MIPAYISLGSNWPDAPEKLAQARKALGARWPIAAASLIYQTEPQNLRDQPWFHNQALKLKIAAIGHIELLRELLAIEKSLGRRRDGPRFGPRAIDIDLLLFGDAISSDPFCLLPHPRLTERAFALVPLLEIEPRIAINGRPAAEWLARLSWRLAGDKIFQ